ncbi:hypothetical protein HMPREF0973_02897 [Prevotella veroralis F0319]|uniref:Uncharacterized protein n=1 Tax=Prevotella veroralis F0319 TaxID=649761 RepID=C9MTC4_9BACT|nr:hypothetical protein HMPREF0973_02897 [Prevotella veroralis F0319]
MFSKPRAIVGTDALVCPLTSLYQLTWIYEFGGQTRASVPTFM